MRGCEPGTGRRSWPGPGRLAVRGSDRGFVTAESAVVLPVLVMFAMALVWGLLVVAAQIQCVDAARTGARAAARQDPADAVIEVTREAAPPARRSRSAGRGTRSAWSSWPSRRCWVAFPSRSGRRPWRRRRTRWGRGHEKGLGSTHWGWSRGRPRAWGGARSAVRAGRRCRCRGRLGRGPRPGPRPRPRSGQGLGPRGRTA